MVLNPFVYRSSLFALWVDFASLVLAKRSSLFHLLCCGMEGMNAVTQDVPKVVRNYLLMGDPIEGTIRVGFDKV